MKKILEEGKKLLYSLINRANIMIMLYYQKWRYRLNIIHIKISATFYTQLEKKKQPNSPKINSEANNSEEPKES